MKESNTSTLTIVISLIIGFLIGFSLFSNQSEGRNYELESVVEEFEWENSRRLECIETLQSQLYDVRRNLENYGYTYEDLYHTVRETERMVDPHPYQCP